MLNTLRESGREIAMQAALMALVLLPWRAFVTRLHEFGAGPEATLAMFYGYLAGVVICYSYVRFVRPAVRGAGGPSGRTA